MLDEKLLQRLEIVQENVNLLTEEEFALLRRNGIGASDTSAIMGTMDKFRTANDVLNNKLEKFYTDDERAIGEKTVVRKGKDLEPFILQKAQLKLRYPIIKPTSMYRIKEFPHLTINYDGLCEVMDDIIPVEAKFVSTFGDKYYDFTRADTLHEIVLKGMTIEERAAAFGVPPYYYLQVQQQLLGTGAPYAYLAALRDKDWTVYLFLIYADDEIQKRIITETYLFWQKVLKAKIGPV